MMDGAGRLRKRRILNGGAREVGLALALLMFVLTSYTLFADPRIGGVNYGSYDQTLEDAGLVYATDEPSDMRYYKRVSETFDYGLYDGSKLLRPGNRTVVYAISLVRLFTAPLGLGFSTIYLACLYILILALSTYLMVSSLYPHTRVGAIAAGLAMALIFSRSSITGYLNSLYDQGAAIVMLMLYAACITRALSRPRGAGIGPVLSVVFAGAMLLCAQAQFIVFLPAVLAGSILSAVRCLRGSGSFPRYAALVLALLWCLQSAAGVYSASADIHSNAASYLCVFQGFLASSADPEADLEELDLSSAYAKDVGRSYYDPEETFAVNPRTEEAENDLFPKINTSARVRFCLRHPDRVMAILDLYKNHFYDAENERIRTVGNDPERYTRPGIYAIIDMFFPQGNFVRQNMYMAVAAFGWLLCALAMRRRKNAALPLMMLLLLMGMLLYLPACVAFSGGTDIDMAKVLFLFFGMAGLATSAALAATGVSALYGVMRGRAAEEPEAGPAAARIHIRMPGFLVALSGSRRRAVAFTAALSLLVLLVLLAVPPHVGGINNGDYGRMMDELDINWTQERNADFSLQIGEVIETFDLREPYQWKRLTPLEPSYSLAYPAALVRLCAWVTGAPFSTMLLAVIMLAMTVWGMLLIIWDLYPLLGRGTLAVAIIMVAMVLGENYVVWYNSLFGESSISTGLIMTLACAVHLAVMPRGDRKSLIWLVLLTLSVAFLTCAKAQMALALPAGAALIVIFSVYHRPPVLRRGLVFVLAILLMVGWTGWSAVHVYLDNNEVSARQTVWQSVFYGALMISEDPLEAMDELGIDRRMAPDIGKHAYYAEDQYVIAPMSEAAGPAFYDHVNTLTMVKYYLCHPKDFLRMLDHAASQSVDLHTGFMGYVGQNYDADHNEINRFNYWRNFRPTFACHTFWQYALLYMLMAWVCIRQIASGKRRPTGKLLAAIFLCVMALGVLQFPLTVVGNGFADNNKQLYCFMLCHDILIVSAAAALPCLAREWNEVRHTRRSGAAASSGKTGDEGRQALAE